MKNLFLHTKDETTHFEEQVAKGYKHVNGKGWFSLFCRSWKNYNKRDRENRGWKRTYWD